MSQSQAEKQHDYFPKLKATLGKDQANSIIAKISAPSDKQLTDEQSALHHAFINYRNTVTLVALMTEDSLPQNQRMLTLHETSLQILQQHLTREELNILTIAITQADLDSSQ